jgi:ketosteroid isomerase-like protein
VNTASSLKRSVWGHAAPILALVFWLIASSSQALAASTTEKSVKTFTFNFLRAFEDLDMPRFIDCFTAEATMFFPSPEPSNRFDGKPAIQAHFEQVFAGIRAGATSGPPYHHLVAEDLTVQSLGTSGAVVSFHLRSAERIARRTLVLTRENGNWRIAHLHASNAHLKQPQ